MSAFLQRVASSAPLRRSVDGMAVGQVCALSQRPALERRILDVGSHRCSALHVLVHRATAPLSNSQQRTCTTLTQQHAHSGRLLWPSPARLVAHNYDKLRGDRLAAASSAVSGVAQDTGEVASPHQVSQPSQEVLNTWQSVRTVLFNISSVLDVSGLVSALAARKGAGTKTASISSQLKSQQLTIDSALRACLTLGGCDAYDVQACLASLDSKLAPEVSDLVAALMSHGVTVCLNAPDLRDVALPVAGRLGISPENVFATPAQHATGAAVTVQEPLASAAGADGKALGMQKLRQRNPYSGIAVVGDSVAELTAAQGADLFIGFRGFREEAELAARVAWVVRDYSQLTRNLRQYQVAFIGSGAWASAAAKLAAENIVQPGRKDLFKPQIKVWVFEEVVDGRKLSDIINEDHENVKYLPGVKLPENIVACPDLQEVARDASVLVVCTPHQFVYGICKQLRGIVDPSAVAISLIKGMRVRPEGPQLISEMVRRTLGIDCSVLMGANIAEEVAKEQLSEGTIGYHVAENGQLFRKLFEADYYLCSLVPDVAGAEIAGTLKNVVALGAGFVDGLGGGANPKATIIRNGLIEMKRLAQALYPTVRDETFLESCGVADLVASCYGGRNRKVAEAYARCIAAGQPKTFDVLEAELLGGQKLQGVLTSNEVQQVLDSRGWQQDYPLFVVIHAIANGRLHPSAIFRFKEAAKQLHEQES